MLGAPSSPSSAAVRIVAVDLQEMAPLAGVAQLQGDITQEATARSIIHLLGDEKAELVVCDGAPDVTGLHDLDEYMQSQLIVAALNITTFVLREGGTFVAKIFRGADLDLLRAQLGMFFERVAVSKPKSSRASSAEAFVVCQQFRLPVGYTPRMVDSMTELRYGEFEVPTKAVVPFLSCGDLEGYDAAAAASTTA
nr:tRNA (cytidine(32)/guanosine(34)-2'-O)-methyltransferase [Seculamonas ecuadoriensis]